MPSVVAAYATQSGSSPLAPINIGRRDVGATDVQIAIEFCGVCHSDLHTGRGEWPGVTFPVVPGHEIVGKVTAVGASVKKHKPGDTVAVGCMVDSCRTCEHCGQGLEQYCDQLVLTYNSPDKHVPGQMTYGGYSKSVVVDEAFVVRVPEALTSAERLPGAAPLLCAGITTYSPLRHWEAGPGKKVGIVGLGGLGHMGVKLAHAMGAHTVLFTTSQSKVADARRLGADDVVLSLDQSQMKQHAGSFDFILNTVAAAHDLDAYTALLRLNGTLCLVGAPAQPHPSPSIWNLLLKRRSIAGSIIGGIAQTQEMLDFCADKGITSDVELIPIQQINTAWDRMLKGDVKYRFVIDMATL